MAAHSLIFFVPTTLWEHLGPARLQCGPGNMGPAVRVAGHRETTRPTLPPILPTSADQQGRGGLTLADVGKKCPAWLLSLEVT